MGRTEEGKSEGRSKQESVKVTGIRVNVRLLSCKLFLGVVLSFPFVDKKLLFSFPPTLFALLKRGYRRKKEGIRGEKEGTKEGREGGS